MIHFRIGLKRPFEAQTAYLVPSDWNDWYDFKTLYKLSYVDENCEQISIGYVKIGQFDQKEERPKIPEFFSRLNDDFFPWDKTKIIMKHFPVCHCQHVKIFLKA
jgi:hypothetical protein